MGEGRVEESDGDFLTIRYTGKLYLYTYILVGSMIHLYNLIYLSWEEYKIIKII